MNFPFRCKYIITQGYNDNANNYQEGHHGAIDVLPIDNTGLPFPALIYPVFDGSEVSINDTDSIKGKGVREEVYLDQDWIEYYKGLGLIPQNHTGKVIMQILYWHMLQVTDKDGTLTQNTPIGLAGNTGQVYHVGKPVPDNLKGVYPYLGLHLHLECLLAPESGQYFNLDKDPHGRIDPMTIFNRKEQSMHLANDNGTIYLISGSSHKTKLGIADIDTLLEVFSDEPIIEEDTSHIPETHTLGKGFIINKK